MLYAEFLATTLLDLLDLYPLPPPPLPSYPPVRHSQLPLVSPLIGIRSQQLNTLFAVFCLPGLGWVVLERLMLGDSLMCLPDQQIRFGSGTRTPLW